MKRKPTVTPREPHTSGLAHSFPLARVHVLEHPLVAQQIALLRDVRTEAHLFRVLVRRLSSLLVYEASREFPQKKIAVATPLARAEASVIDARIALVPILRAGLGMVEAILDVLPHSRVYHVGVKRDERTLKPKQYYTRLPEKKNADIALVLDPMLATGGSACAVIRALKEQRIPRIKFLGIVAAPEGLERLTREHPDVEVYLCVLDERLNKKGYILPGLGDAGDRQFA